MTLHINEAEVRSVFTMGTALGGIEEISRKQAEGEVIVHPRRRFELPHGGFFHYMAAADFSSGYLVMKQYTYVRGKLRFLVPLYEISSGDLVALIEADYMGQVRTGAASGVATKLLARQNARTAGIIGTGGQARTQLEAVAAVRKLEHVRVFGRHPQRRAAFAKEMSERLSLEVMPVRTPAEAVRGADIICTATTSSNPVVNGEEIPSGAHINAIGANHSHKRELDDEAIAKADVVFVDSVEQSRLEAGDLILGFHGDVSRWARVHELADLVAGKCPGRSHDRQVTLFKSNGIAAWDLASAIKVFAMAKEKNLGRPLPLWRPSV